MILGSLAFGAGGRTVFAGVLAFRMRKQIDTGAYLSSTNAVASVCAGVMPVIAGAIIESYSGHVGYSVVFLIFSIVGIILLITLGLFFVWHRKHKKKQYKYKNEI
jgi:MFS family permease